VVGTGNGHANRKTNGADKIYGLTAATTFDRWLERGQPVGGAGKDRLEGERGRGSPVSAVVEMTRYLEMAGADAAAKVTAG